MAEKPKREPPTPPTFAEMAKGCFTLAALIGVGFMVYACMNAPQKTDAERAADLRRSLNKIAAPKGTDVLPIWRDYAALQKGEAMLSAGQAASNAETFDPLTACVINRGDPVMITSTGFVYEQVLVTAGPFKGCEGVTELELLADTPPTH